MNTPPKILITGGLGFIFSHVTEYFVKKGWDVVVMDKEATGSHPEIIDGSFKYYHLDVCKSETIDIIQKEVLVWYYWVKLKLYASFFKRPEDQRKIYYANGETSPARRYG